MSLKRVAPAPTDEQLALAERTDNVRRRDRIAAIDDEQEQQRLADAGEPESGAQLALRATASVLNSRPNRAEEKDDDAQGDETALGSTTEDAGGKRHAPKSRNASTRTRKAAPPPPQEEDPDPEKAQKQQDDKAYELMDTAYRKWGVAAKKDLRKANRELAIDLGKDTALYLRSGIIRLADLHAAIDRLTANKTGEKERDEDAEDFESELETMRAALRNEK